MGARGTALGDRGGEIVVGGPVGGATDHGEEGLEGVHLVKRPREEHQKSRREITPLLGRIQAVLLNFV